MSSGHGTVAFKISEENRGLGDASRASKRRRWYWGMSGVWAVGMGGRRGDIGCVGESRYIGDKGW